jgi:hypothetical protein
VASAASIEWRRAPFAGRCRDAAGWKATPRIWAGGGFLGFGSLPVDLKDLTHGHLEVVEVRTLAARRYQLGVGADGQA